MSSANLPNITPTISISRDDAISLLISAIAMQELGLSHIINAEGEKLQFALGTLPGVTPPEVTIDNILAMNNSVNTTLREIVKNEYFLAGALEAALSSPTLVGPTGPTGPTGPAGGPTGPSAPSARWVRSALSDPWAPFSAADCSKPGETTPPRLRIRNRDNRRNPACRPLLSQRRSRFRSFSLDAQLGNGACTNIRTGRILFRPTLRFY